MPTFMATSQPMPSISCAHSQHSAPRIRWTFGRIKRIWRETVSLPGNLPLRYPKMCFVYILIYFRHWRGPTLSQTCQLKHPTSGGNSMARLDHRSMYHEDHEGTSYLKSKAAPKIWPDKICKNLMGDRASISSNYRTVLNCFFKEGAGMEPEHDGIGWSPHVHFVARWLRVSAPFHDEGQGQCPKRVAILVHEEGRHRLA